MQYSIRRIFHNIRLHLGVYLIFILEFAIGIAILSGTLTVLVSLQKDLDAEREKMMADKIRVVYSPPLGVDYSEDRLKNWEEQIIITDDTFYELEKRYGNSMKLNYYIKTHNDEFMVVTWDTVFVSDDMFESLFGFPMEEGKMYAGEDIYDDVVNYKDFIQKKNKVSYDTLILRPVVWVENDEYVLSKKNIYQLEKAPMCSIEALPSGQAVSLEEYWTKTAKCLYVPLKEFPTYLDLLRREYHPINVTENSLTPNFQTALSVEYRDKDFDVNLFPDMLSFLMERNNKYEFTADMSVLQLQYTADSLDGKISDMIAISICVLFVVILGTTGLFLIYLYRRKRQMAVSIAYGSTFSRLFWEIFAEVLIVTGMGAVLGILAVKKIMPYAVQMYHGAEFQPICIAVAIAAALVSSIIVVGLSFAGIGETSPAKILKDL